MSEVELAGEVVSYLVRRYPGVSATRAMWSWAGGSATTAPLEGEAEALWRAGWEAAGAPADGERPAPSQVALVREALYDEPGEPLLLDYLFAEACERHDERLADAVILFEALARAVAVAAPTELVAATLAAFGVGSWEEAFVCLAPGSEEWLEEGARAALQRACAEIVRKVELADALAALRAELRAIDTPEAADEAVTDAVAELEELLAQAAAELPATDALRRGLERLVARVARRKKLTLLATVAGITSALVESKRYEGAAPLRAAAEGLRSALWATHELPPPREELRPEDLALEEDDEEEEEEEGEGEGLSSF